MALAALAAVAAAVPSADPFSALYAIRLLKRIYSFHNAVSLLINMFYANQMTYLVDHAPDDSIVIMDALSRYPAQAKGPEGSLLFRQRTDAAFYLLD